MKKIRTFKKNRTFKKKRTFIKKRTFRKYRGLYNKYTNLTHKIKGGAQIFPRLREKLQKFFSRDKEIEPGVTISKQHFRSLEKQVLAHANSYDIETLRRVYHLNMDILDTLVSDQEQNMESIFREPTISSAKKDEIRTTYRTAVTKAKDRWKITGNWMQAMINIAYACDEAYRRAGLVPVDITEDEYSSTSSSPRESPRESPTQSHEIAKGLIISEEHFRWLVKEALLYNSSYDMHTLSEFYHFNRKTLDRQGIRLEKDMESIFQDPTISSAKKDEIRTTYRTAVTKAKERWKISGDWHKAMIDIVNARLDGYREAGLVPVIVNTREVAESPTSSSSRISPEQPASSRSSSRKSQEPTASRRSLSRSNLFTPRTPRPTGMEKKANKWRAQSTLSRAQTYMYRDAMETPAKDPVYNKL